MPATFDTVPTGAITYGALDDEHCESDVMYLPLDPGCGHYCMKLEKVSFGATTIEPPQSRGWFVLYPEITFIHVFGLRYARSDIGNSLITGPADVVEQIVQAAGWDGQRTACGDYLIDCNAQMDPIVFHIDGKEVILESKHLITWAVCDLRQCRINIKGHDGNVWGLGLPFARQHCQIHDFENSKLGLAKPRE